MFQLASEAVVGTALDEALSNSRHAVSELDAELRKTKKDLLKIRQLTIAAGAK